MGRRSKQRKRKYEHEEDEVEVEEVEVKEHEEQLIPYDFIPVARLSKEQIEYSKNLLEIISNETTELSELNDFEPILKELEGKEESYMCDYYGSLLMKELIRKISNSNSKSMKMKYIQDLLKRLNLRNLLLNVHACKVLEEILLTTTTETETDEQDIIQEILKSLSLKDSSLEDTLLFYSKQKFSVHFIRLLLSVVVQKKLLPSPADDLLSIFRRKDLIFHPFI